MKVAYSRQTLETPNPIARFAHRKRYELSIEQAVGFLGSDKVLLDFGCGKGDFLNKISELKPNSKLLGFDPESGHASSKYNIVNSMDHVESNSVDVFCSFETLEHLYDDERHLLYSEANRVLKKSGVIIISVPIIGGPPLLLKELNRMLLFRRKSEYSFKELFLACFLGISAKHPENPRPTHKGFDFREIEHELSEHFSINRKSYSPFSALGWYLNSQVFYVCKTLK